MMKEVVIVLMAGLVCCGAIQADEAALDAMHAAPRGVLAKLDLPGWRVEVEELAIHRELREVLLFDVAQCITERHLAMAMVVSVGLAIGRDVDQLGMFTTRREGACQAVREDLAALQDIVRRLSGGKAKTARASSP